MIVMANTRIEERRRLWRGGQWCNGWDVRVLGGRYQLDRKGGCFKALLGGKIERKGLKVARVWTEIRGRCVKQTWQANHFVAMLRAQRRQTLFGGGDLEKKKKSKHDFLDTDPGNKRGRRWLLQDCLSVLSLKKKKIFCLLCWWMAFSVSLVQATVLQNGCCYRQLEKNFEWQTQPVVQ